MAAKPTPAPPRSVLRATDKFRWPGGKRVAVVFNLAYEGWSDGEAPGIGPMGNVLKPGYFDTNADSWARFGAVRGIQRLLRIAEANGIKTSVMASGVLARDHAETFARIRDGGHEIVGHSWGMDVIHLYLDEAGERENIKRNTDAIKAACGAAPTGWISPRGTGSLISSSLLAEAGYVWQGDCNDDDLPAVTLFDNGRRIVDIPLTMDVNDLPHSNRYGNTPRAFVESFSDIMEGTARADPRPFMLDVTAHAHAYGRAAGAWTIDAIMKLALARDDVWIATRQRIAEYTLNQGMEWMA
jgi:peptidoglycan/xylan/chitin deacetylase (PgdA/CDA1 family)